MSEPPIDRNPEKLDETFRRKLMAVISDLAGHGLTAVINEGWRSPERQKWLYAQGRTRPGPVVTQKNGTTNRSYHQSGKAADIIFTDGSGHRYWPPLKVGDAYAPEWELVHKSATAHELGWGGSWGWDAPHLELR